MFKKVKTIIFYHAKGVGKEFEEEALKELKCAEYNKKLADAVLYAMQSGLYFKTSKGRYVTDEKGEVVDYIDTIDTVESLIDWVEKQKRLKMTTKTDYDQLGEQVIKEYEEWLAENGGNYD